MSTKPTADRVREIYDYNPITGLFKRKVRTSNRIKIGQIAGTENAQGYILLTVDSIRYLAHRIAWLYVHGEMPGDMIDHINGNRSDNRIDNLRQANNAENLRNRGKTASNKSGFKGVSFDKRTQKWMARIGVGYQARFLGRFDTPEAAHTAYVDAAQKLHGEFANAGRQQ